MMSNFTLRPPHLVHINHDWAVKWADKLVNWTYLSKEYMLKHKVIGIYSLTLWLMKMPVKLMNSMFNLFLLIMELNDSFMKIKPDTKAIMIWMRDEYINQNFYFIYFIISFL